jgi:hypothetical protein
MATRTVPTCNPLTDVSKLNNLQSQGLLVWAMAWLTEYVETRPPQYAADAKRQASLARKERRFDAAKEQLDLHRYWKKLCDQPFKQRLYDLQASIMEDDALFMELEVRDGGPGTFGRMVYEAVEEGIKKLLANPFQETPNV